MKKDKRRSNHNNDKQNEDRKKWPGFFKTKEKDTRTSFKKMKDKISHSITDIKNCTIKTKSTSNLNMKPVNDANDTRNMYNYL